MKKTILIVVVFLMSLITTVTLETNNNPSALTLIFNREYVNNTYSTDIRKDKPD